MGVSRVDLNGKTLIDLTSDTVSEDTLIGGVTAHNSAGELIEGKASAVNDVTFESEDALEAESWSEMSLIETNEKQNSLFQKFSLAVKNIRWLYKMLGTKDISALGDGTVTGAIDQLNDKINGSSFPEYGYFTGNVKIITRELGPIEHEKTTENLTMVVGDLTDFGLELTDVDKVLGIIYRFIKNDRGSTAQSKSIFAVTTDGKINLYFHGGLGAIMANSYYQVSLFVKSDDSTNTLLINGD